MQANRIGKQEAHWAGVIFIFGLIAVLFMTLLPLAIALPQDGMAGFLTRVDFRLIKSDNLTDWVRNIVLFVPLGFGLSALLARRKRPFLQTLLPVTFLGFLLSLFLETYQALNPYREPAIADVVANTVGTLVGSVLFLLVGSFILNALVAVTQAMRHAMQQHKLVAGFVLLIMFFGYLALVGQLIHRLQQQVSLANWDIRVPLSLGNVKTGELPWTGGVAELLLVDEALDVTAVSALFAGTAVENLVAANTNTTQATFPDNPVLIDHAGKNITFNWTGDPSVRTDANGTKLTSENWLLTDDIIGWWAEDIRVADQFTLGLQMATAVVEPADPARILAMTHHQFVSNISLEQQGTDLIILLRTVLAGESDKLPAWVIPGFFEDKDIHHLVLTFDGQNLNLYRDATAENWQIPYAADIIFYRYLHPIPQWRAQVGPTLWLYRLLFYLLTAVPLGLILGAFVTLLPRRWLQIIMFVIGVVFVGVVLELALNVVGDGLRWQRLLLGMGGMAVAALWSMRQTSNWLRSTTATS